MKDVDVNLNASLITRLRVESFLADYVHALDSDRLEEWPDFFVEDASYQVITRENVERGLPLAVMSCQGRGMFRDRISALRTANIFEPHVYCHILGSLRILGEHRRRHPDGEHVQRNPNDGRRGHEPFCVWALARPFRRWPWRP